MVSKKPKQQKAYNKHAGKNRWPKNHRIPFSYPRVFAKICDHCINTSLMEYIKVPQHRYKQI